MFPGFQILTPQYHCEEMKPNQIIGPNAGRPHQFQVWTPLAASAGQFQRWTPWELRSELRSLFSW